MALQGGQVQLELSDMCLALKMSEMAKGGQLHTAIDGTQYRIQLLPRKAQEQTMWGVQFPSDTMGNTAIERKPAIIRQNHTAGCFPHQNRT